VVGLQSQDYTTQRHKWCSRVLAALGTILYHATARNPNENATLPPSLTINCTRNCQGTAVGVCSSMDHTHSKDITEYNKINVERATRGRKCGSFDQDLERNILAYLNTRKQTLLYIGALPVSLYCSHMPTSIFASTFCPRSNP